tara:strand:- start:2583 stop:2786 length:204 start_codon:yes stop_codon:yes gene_type:complete
MENLNKKTNNLEKSKRFIKYLLMGFIILVAIRYIPNKTLDTKEICMIAFISSISFAILDMISPTIKI